jgi:hypothetical protein
MEVRRPSWLLIGVLCAACQAASPSPAPSSMVPPADMFGLAWTEQLGIIVSYSTFDQPEPLRLAKADDGALVDLVTGDLPDCGRTSANVPLGLQDGRLAYLATCVDQIDPTVSAVEAMDAAGTSMVVASSESRVMQAGALTANPDGTVFYIGYGGAFCSTILRIDASGSHLIPWVVSGPGQPFRFDVEPARDGQCADAAWIDQPSLSPDGLELAFVASPDSIGKVGQARLDAPRGIYVADVATGGARLILGGIRDPRGLAYAHDGRRLAFSGELSDGRHGTWMVDETTADVQLVTDLTFEWLSWSPDDTRIAGIVPSGTAEEPLNMSLVQIPVP